MRLYFIITFYFFTIPLSSFADQKTDYFAKNCYKSAINLLDYMIKGSTFSTSFRYGKIQTKDILYPNTQSDSLTCELRKGSCESSYTMRIKIYERMAWGEEKLREHKCYFKENGFVTRVE